VLQEHDRFPILNFTGFHHRYGLAEGQFEDVDVFLVDAPAGAAFGSPAVIPFQGRSLATSRTFRGV